MYFTHGISFSFPNEKSIDIIILIVEIVVAGYIITVGFKNKKIIVSILSILQTGFLLFFEFNGKSGIEVKNDIIFDKLTAIMVLIVGLVGSLICVYAISYMKSYHIHHDKLKDRKNFFFSVLFVFLFAMFGLVLSNNLTWIFFCWELTTLCSF
jgi:ech hydrogenase subunit A